MQPLIKKQLHLL